MGKVITSLGVLVIAIGATVAYFSDTEISDESVFSAGIMDMKIRNTRNSNGWGDGVKATWVADNMFPGDERKFLAEGVELAKEIGSIEANHVEIAVDYNVNKSINLVKSGENHSQSDQHANEMAKEMLLTRCVYNGFVCIDCLTGKKYDGYNYTDAVCGGNEIGQSDDWKIDDQDKDGKTSFYDLKKDKLDNLPPVGNNLPFSFAMSIKFNEDAGNNFQGDQFVLDVIFTLNQDKSQ